MSGALVVRPAPASTPSADGGARGPSFSSEATDSHRTPTRVDSLDGLRTVAVMLVVAFHFGVPGFSGGYLGVDVFFVLSGFLITTLLIKELAARGRIDLARFWTRRFLRLMPAALLVILVVVAWGLVAAEPYRRPALGADALWSLLYVGNWRFIDSAGYFSDDGTSSPLLHVWSLAVEEQFYFVWPLLLSVVGTVVWRRVRTGSALDSVSRVETQRRRRIAVAVCAGALALVLAAASAVLLWWLYDGDSPDRAYMGTDSKIFEPLVGALAAAVMTRPRVQRWVVRRCTALVLLGLVGIAVGVCTLGGPSPAYFAGGAVVFSLCCAVLVAAATAGGNLDFVERTLGFAPLAYVGRISYGVYLWHWPVALWTLPSGAGPDLVRIVVATALTIALASVSYHLFELPIRTGRMARVRPLRLVPVGVTSLVIAVCASTFLGGTPLSRFNPAAQAITGADRSVVVTVGDSVMSRMVPALAAAAGDQGLTVLSASRGGCPALTVPAIGPDDRLLANGACTERVRETQDQLIAQHSPGVVLWWSRYELADRLGDDGRILRAGTPQFWAAQHASFLAEVERLTAHGAILVVVRTDRPGIGLASRCTPEKCDPFLARLWHDDSLRQDWNALVDGVAQRDERVRVIDIDDVYCRDDGIPCDDRLPIRALGTERIDGTGGHSSRGSGPSQSATTAPRPRATVTTTDFRDLARPDGTHFSPQAAPPVAAALLARILAARDG